MISELNILLDLKEVCLEIWNIIKTFFINSYDSVYQFLTRFLPAEVIGIILIFGLALILILVFMKISNKN